MILTSNHEPMYMKDWLETIDDYLKMTRREILTTKGQVSHKQAIDKAHAEYDKYKRKQEELLSNVEKDFIESIDVLEYIENQPFVSKLPRLILFCLCTACRNAQILSL